MPVWARASSTSSSRWLQPSAWPCSAPSRKTEPRRSWPRDSRPRPLSGAGTTSPSWSLPPLWPWPSSSLRFCSGRTDQARRLVSSNIPVSPGTSSTSCRSASPQAPLRRPVGRIRSERAGSGLLAVVINDRGDVVADPQEADELAPHAQVVQLGLAGAVGRPRIWRLPLPGYEQLELPTTKGCSVPDVVVFKFSQAFERALRIAR